MSDFEAQLKFQRTELLFQKNQSRQLRMKDEQLIQLKIQNDVLFDRLKNKKNKSLRFSKDDFNVNNNRIDLHLIEYNYKIQSLKEKFEEDLRIERRKQFDLQETISKLEKENSILKDCLSEIKIENKSLNSEVSSLKVIYKSQKEEVNGMKYELNSIKTQISKHKALVKPIAVGAGESIYALNEKLKSKSEQVEFLKAKIENLEIQTKINILEDRNRFELKSNAEIQELNKKNKILEKQIIKCENLIYQLMEK
eukprot:NODE_413_length_7912_cov_0.917061.p4 type:complete len:253 gc:universal NODE_413_length_7912_cov_0.917061:4219-3461(-)